MSGHNGNEIRFSLGEGVGRLRVYSPLEKLRGEGQREDDGWGQCRVKKVGRG